jgi:hypothetical protein
MYTRSVRLLLSDTRFGILLRSDTDRGPMYIRFARILLSDTHFAILLRSDTNFGLMYIRSVRILFQTHISLFCCVLTQILV